MESHSLPSAHTPDEIFEGHVLLRKLMLGFMDSMCLKWCVELRIPEIIHKHGKPITLHELVSTLQVPQSKIHGVESLMRFLARSGFFDIVRIQGGNNNQDEYEAYALTASSELLVRGTSPCLAPMIESGLAAEYTNQFNHLSKWTFVEGVSLCKIANGVDAWEFVTKDPARLTRFNEAMASDCEMFDLALRNRSSVFEGLETIVDVGGGTGTIAKIITNMIPGLKCIVYDRPQVVENLSGNNNVSYVGGDMFKSIPMADAVLLKWILHDWSDDECIKILEKCKAAISGKEKGGKIIIIDSVISEKRDGYDLTQLKLKLDIFITTLVNGRERSEEEWKKLFMKVGFKDYKISSLNGVVSLIEVFP